jgi:broad specificity phosphatase PhoE
MKTDPKANRGAIMPLLYLVRHGEPAAMWGAHPDPGLSPAGHEQAKAAARAIAELGPHAILTSPMVRCQETAHPTAAVLARPPQIEPAIAEVPVPAHVDDRRTWLTRLMFGSWHEAWIEDTLRAWRRDVGLTLASLKEDTVLFTHFIAINAAVGMAVGSEQVVSFQPSHASITVLDNQMGFLSLKSLGAQTSIALT